MTKAKLILCFMLVPIYLTGCWDKVEIEERAFVSAVGIDLFQGEEQGEKDVKEKIDEPRETPDNRYSIIYVFPNLNSIGKNATSDKTRFILGSVGKNPFETTMEISTRSNKDLFFRHMKVAIIGEDVARNSNYMREILDSFERHDQINRKLILLIAEGAAKDVIEVEPLLDPVTGRFLSEIINKTRASAKFNPQNLGDILASIHGTGRALIPRIVPGEDEIKIAGSAVFKNYKLIGWIGELENRALMFLKGEVGSEIINIVDKNITIPFIITGSDIQKSAKIDAEKIRMNYFIEIEGYVQQYNLDAKTEILDNKQINSIEKKVENKLQEEIKGTIRKMQKDFKVDVIGVGEYLSKFKPDVWDEVQDEWENMFPNIDVTVIVEVKLRRVGMTR